MSLRNARGLLLSGLLVLQATAVADDKSGPAFSVGGLLFGDFYHVPSHHLSEGDGATGVVLRRGYLTFDADFSDTWFARLRFEANQSGAFESYDYEADIKDLYVGGTLGRHTVLAGLTPTPAFDLIESIWGARYLARTPMDLQGVPSRDTGIFAKGPLNASGTFSYRALLGAGTDFESDGNDEKSGFRGALSWSPTPGWTLDFYADYNRTEGRADRRTLQGFIGYRDDNYRWGAQYSHQDRQEEAPLELASAFAIARVSQRIELIGRIDRLIEPSPRGNDIAYIPFDPSAPATMFLGGLEFNASGNFTLTPNVVFIRYGINDEGARPTDDLLLRLTLFLDFE